MKKRRLWAFIMLPLLLAACAPAGEAGTTEISCPTAEGPAPDTNPMPEHPFTADAGLSAALGDYPGLVYAAAGDGDGGYRRYLLSRDGYYLSAEESVGPLYDALADTPARYYTSTRELPGGGQETAVFNMEGYCVSGYDESQIILLAGDILVRGEYEVEGTDAPTYCTGVAFTDLTTGEVLLEPGRCRVSLVDGAHLLLCLQPEAEGPSETRILDAGTLEAVKTFPGMSGISEIWQHTPVPDGWVLLTGGDGATSAYSVPLDRTFPGFFRLCGEGMLVRDEAGELDLVRLSDGETVLEDTHPRHSYWTETFSYWIGENGWQPYLLCPAYGEEPVAVRYATDGFAFAVNDYYAVQPEEGALDLVGRDGGLIQSFPADGEIYPNYRGHGWVRTRTESGCVYYAPDGGRYPVEGEDSWVLWEDFLDPRFARLEPDGSRTLLDPAGQPLLEGLQEVYCLEEGLPVLCAMQDGRLGLLDLDGGWLWREPSDAAPAPEAFAEPGPEPEAPPRTGESETFGAEAVPEHPFTADADLSAALGDYPGLLQLYAAPGATLVGPAGYYQAAEEERLDLLYGLSPGSPVAYYVAYRRLEEESEAANTALFENAVFDTSGRCVSGYDKTDILLLAGDILVRGDYGGKKMDPSRIFADSALFIDIRTGEILWEAGRCLVRAFDENHLTVTLQESEDAEPELLLLDAATLQVVKRFPGVSGEDAMGVSVPEGCLKLPDGFYSLPLDRTFSGLEQFCGEAALLWNESGGYDVVRLSDGETVETGVSRRYVFWSEAVRCWEGEALWPKYCLAPAAYGDEPVEVYAAGGGPEDGHYTVRFEDQSVDFLTLDGTLFYSIRSEDFVHARTDFWPGWERRDWYFIDADDGLYYISLKGESIFFPGRSSYTTSSLILEDGLCRFIAYGEEGPQIIDENGTALTEGMESLYPVYFAGEDSPAMVNAAQDGQTGLMDLNGSWLWRIPS